MKSLRITAENGAQMNGEHGVEKLQVADPFFAPTFALSLRQWPTS